MSKERLDVRLVEEGFFDSREKAKRAIMAGLILVDGQISDKPGTLIKDTQLIDMKGAGLKYVSRGGLKLERAVTYFGLDLNHAVCMDVGASTGGFTDCMLQSGAAKVYAVDVGYGQLDWKLRNDPRVVNLERTNARHLTQAEIPEPVDFVSIDVAFISLKLILPAVAPLMKPEGRIVFLIKPQFEAGREHIGKNGVVRDPKVHLEVLRDVLTEAERLGFYMVGLTYSPIRGPKGNIEFLCCASRNPAHPGARALSEFDLDRIVEDAHKIL